MWLAPGSARPLALTTTRLVTASVGHGSRAAAGGAPPPCRSRHPVRVSRAGLRGSSRLQPEVYSVTPENRSDGSPSEVKLKISTRQSCLGLSSQPQFTRWHRVELPQSHHLSSFSSLPSPVVRVSDVTGPGPAGTVTGVSLASNTGVTGGGGATQCHCARGRAP